jgi:hypothetical protein
LAVPVDTRWGLEYRSLSVFGRLQKVSVPAGENDPRAVRCRNTRSTMPIPQPRIGFMAREVPAATSGRPEVDDLLPLALSRPHEALAKARMILRGQPGTYEASVAHQAAGIVLREFGDVAAGIGELRIALSLACQAPG